ncbi:MAG: thymidine phosphorylase [Actinomycetota bacterium]
MSYSMPELIGAKRDGGSLAAEELEWIIAEYTADRIPDYQLSAFLMAVIFRGMSQGELAAWTDAMLHSGDVLDLSSSPLPKVDKHSTGGVGDKISIPLAPLVAACGLGVPMMSGRGLGHTGGTLDKLESIPGFRTRIDPDEFVRQFNELGIVLAGQSETLVPADRRIYALRDASGTVPAIPLISSSIMSKKLAEDLDGLVLDVKIGSGAFMKDVASGTELAETMVGIGRSHDTPVVGILTDMDQPLGAEVGNANEMVESIAVLRGEGPEDVTELTMLLGAEMLVLGGLAGDVADGRSQLETAVTSGAGLEVFEKVIVAHGGDPRVLEDTAVFPTGRHEHVITADRAGYVERCDALTVGRSAVRLGAGRRAKEDDVDPGVGITVLARVGDALDAGAPLATVRYNTEAQLDACLPVLETAWNLTDEPQSPRPLILGEVR